jgi:hypothetical protein
METLRCLQGPPQPLRPREGWVKQPEGERSPAEQIALATSNANILSPYRDHESCGRSVAGRRTGRRRSMASNRALPLDAAAPLRTAGLAAPVLALLAAGLSACLSTPHSPLRVDRSGQVRPPVSTRVEDLARSGERAKVQAHSVEDHPGFLLGFVEFDDQGEFWRREQVDLLERAITDRVARDGSSTVLVIVFAHGWRHGSDVCDEHVACFREVLTHVHEDDVQIRGALGPDARPETIVGVHVGWRGLSLQSPFSELSFFARNGAARRVGNGDVVELLTRLDVLVRRVGAGGSERSRLVLVGHSFGATVLYTALSGILKREVSRAIAEAPALPPGGRPPVIRGLGDLLVLVNPAFEASLLSNVYELASRVPDYSPFQPPFLVIVSSETDRATKSFFPIGRWLDTAFQKTRDPKQREAIRTAVGNWKPYDSYRLEPSAPPGVPGAEKLEVSDCGCRLSRTVIDPGELDLLLRFWSPEEVAARAASLSASNAGSCDGSRSYGRARLVCTRPVSRRNPLWVVTASKEVLDGHGRFFGDTLLDFFRWVVLEGGALEAAGAASEAAAATASEAAGPPSSVPGATTTGPFVPRTP